MSAKRKMNQPSRCPAAGEALRIVEGATPPSEGPELHRTLSFIRDKVLAEMEPSAHEAFLSKLVMELKEMQKDIEESNVSSDPLHSWAGLGVVKAGI